MGILKKLSALFAVLLMASIPFCVFAEPVLQGECGTSLNYSLSDDGTLSIAGNGNMFDYTPSSAPWSDNIQSVKRIDISNGTRSIGTCAFVNANVTSVTVPSSVTLIGSYALGYGFDGISYSKIPGFTLKGTSGSAVQSYAVINGFLFESISFVNGTVGSLSWSLSDSGVLTVSGNGAIPDFEPGSSNAWAAYRDGHDGYVIRSLIIEQGVTNIGAHSFENLPALTSVTLPTSIKKIGDSAFEGCPGLDSIDIPYGVSAIGNGSFMLAPFTSVSLPVTVKSIGNNAFYGCDMLMTCEMPGVNMIGDYAFAGCSSLTGVLLSDELETVGASSFEDCSELSEITLPETVTSIGDRAFFGCKSLRSAVIPDSVTALGTSVFSDCSSLNEAVIGNGAEAVTQGMFENCTALKNVTIGSSVSMIDERAFLGCTSLGELTIPYNVKYIAPNSVGYTISGVYFNPVKKFTVCGYTPSVAKEYAQANYFSFTSVGDITSDSGTLDTGVNWSFDMFTGVLILEGEGDVPDYVSPTDAPWHIFNKYIKSVSIGTNVTSIGDYFCYDSPMLADIYGAENVCRIGNYAFCRSGFTELQFPASLTSIGISAFENCAVLEKLVLPDTLENIDEYAFRGAVLLKSVFVPGITSVGYHALGFTQDDTVVPEFTLSGVKDSMAHSYAENTGITFIEKGFIKLTDSDSGASIEIVDPGISFLNVKFEKLADNPENVFLNNNEFAYVYRFTVLSPAGTEITPDENVTFFIPGSGFDRMTLRIFVRGDNGFTQLPFKYSSGMIVTSFGHNADLIITNADLSNLITITSLFMFSDGSEAHEPVISFASPGVEYSVRSAWVKGFHATEQFITDTASENVTVSFTYLPDAAESQNNDDHDKNGLTSGKIVLIIVLTVLSIGVVVAAVYFAKYMIRKKQLDDKKTFLERKVTEQSADPLANTIIAHGITKQEIDIESLFTDEPEKDTDQAKKNAAEKKSR